MVLRSEHDLVAYAVALGATQVPTLSTEETRLVKEARHVAVDRRVVDELRNRILAGQDPIGEAFSRIRSPEQRRGLGATYTPLPVVHAMLAWAASEGRPNRVVDPGVGSARFLIEAGRRFPSAQLIGVDVDPLAALLARASLAAAGLSSRAEIHLTDYREFRLEPIRGTTLFVGNPPYVRHHLIGARWKNWLARVAASRGLSASKLAGLHVYFYLATLRLAQPGDYGTFITAAEWLDVNYGRLLRQIFLDGLGGKSLVMIDPAAQPFPATTAVITTFCIGTKSEAVRVRKIQRLEELSPLDSGIRVRRERLETEDRWTHLLRSARDLPDGFVELGEICRVHRGQVTGNNKVWIAEEHGWELPERVLFPSVTRARDLFDLNGVLEDASRLRRVIDIPVDLDTLEPEERKLIERFLKWARSAGAHTTYVARHRAAWWSVGLRTPPPIIATYMARRPPVFVINKAGARYINIAHGIYPREQLSDRAINRLRDYLNSPAADARGRVYAGGLLKFEPREMERIPVPAPHILEAPERQ